MRKSYDLKTLAVKRRGVLPVLRRKLPAQAHVNITVSIDKDIVDRLSATLGKTGAKPYQREINRLMRTAIDVPQRLQTVKTDLLQDKAFIRQIARQVVRG